MKKILTTLIILLVALTSNAQTPTLIGTHGTSDVNALVSIGSQIARYGFSDYQIKNGIDNGFTQAFDKIKYLDSLGIEQIIHLRWPEDTVNNIGPDWERVPVGADRDTVFLYLDTFLTEVGPYIEYIQINQEPLGNTHYNGATYQMSEVIDWWEDVAIFIRNDTSLSHIKLVTGGISGINGAINDTNGTTAQAIDSIIAFGEAYCDVIDLHLHVTDVIDGENQINYIRSKTNHILGCTEWSQADASTTWLPNTNTVFTGTHPFAGYANKQVIDSAYIYRMDTTEWNMFIATSPYTVNFIPDFYATMDSNCFEFACYGGVVQYGAPHFDWCQLFASKTVVQNMYPNNPFNTEYTNLATLVNSGSYISNCSTTGIEKQKNSEFEYLIYPNPFMESTTIKFNNPNNEEFTLILYNILGECVKSIKNSSEEIVIKRENLKSGIYFFKLQSASEKMSGKIIVE